MAGTLYLARGGPQPETLYVTWVGGIGLKGPLNIPTMWLPGYLGMAGYPGIAGLSGYSRALWAIGLSIYIRAIRAIQV